MSGFLTTILWFLVVLTPIVFVHEFGHYWIARRAGVRVEVFSVGFGREILGWTDAHGTRWKISLIPFGGYVRMFGQSDLGPDKGGDDLSEEARAHSFAHKRLWQRAAIVAGGPLANFAFAIVVFAAMFMTIGQPFTEPRVSEVRPGSAAEQAGFRPNDLIVGVEGRSIQRFEEVQQLIRLYPGIPIRVVVERDGARLTLTPTPEVVVGKDASGEDVRFGMLGIVGLERAFTRRGPAAALAQAVRETGRIVSVTGTALRQIVVGERGTADLGGPIRIAQMSGTAASAGIAAFIVFAAFLSINLGFINLFPIPLLDGGHLLFYAIEAVLGRPPGERVQDLGYKIGLVLVLGLMVFATINDLVRLPLIRQVVDLLS